jgi:hypothetical protein
MPRFPLKRSSASATTAATATSRAVLASPASLSVPVRRIATFHLNGLGDLMFTLPALHALREGFPGATITAVVRPGLIPLLEKSPLVDEVLARPKGGLSAQAVLMSKLASRHFDMAITFSQSRQSVLLALATRAALRLGFEGRQNGFAASPTVCQREGIPYTIESHLGLVRALGIKPRQHDYLDLLLVDPGLLPESRCPAGGNWCFGAICAGGLRSIGAARHQGMAGIVLDCSTGRTEPQHSYSSGRHAAQ